MLERKKKERNMYELEKDVQQRSIEHAKMKYQDKMNIIEEQMLEVNVQQEELEEEQGKLNIE